MGHGAQEPRSESLVAQVGEKQRGSGENQREESPWSISPLDRIATSSTEDSTILLLCSSLVTERSSHSRCTYQLVWYGNFPPMATLALVICDAAPFPAWKPTVIRVLLFLISATDWHRMTLAGNLGWFLSSWQPS